MNILNTFRAKLSKYHLMKIATGLLALFVTLVRNNQMVFLWDINDSVLTVWPYYDVFALFSPQS